MGGDDEWEEMKSGGWEWVDWVSGWGDEWVDGGDEWVDGGDEWVDGGEWMLLNGWMVMSFPYFYPPL